MQTLCYAITSGNYYYSSRICFRDMTNKSELYSSYDLIENNRKIKTEIRVKESCCISNKKYRWINGVRIRGHLDIGSIPDFTPQNCEQENSCQRR